MNITQLARITKIPKQTLHNWISGSQPRDLEQVRRVAIYFEVSLDFLLFGNEIIISDPILDFQNEIRAGIFEVILRRTKPNC
ncbi:MAG: helix-turn-helix transcriptional regulator [Oligoflexia bacterium]|nr:helix-turn-helix transcriptional regulator [Oligoflexia bacterium]